MRRWDLRLSERLTKGLGYASQRINAHWQRNGVVIYRFYEYIRHRKQAHQRRLRTRLRLQRSVLRSASASSRPHAAVSQANSPCIHSLAFTHLHFLVRAAQPQTETESNGIKLVAACIKEDMWLEAHLLASLLLKSVPNLFLRQRILNPLEAGGA